MHILLTNDDGIHAEGILALGEGLVSAGHRISVCAPDRERSGVSHAITLNRPLRAEPADFPGAEHAWSVDGSPADSASLGLWLTRDDPVDLVIAGINRGMNLGGAAVYSGTVAAAMEASMCGTPALAVSLCLKQWSDPADFSAAARLAVRTAAWAIDHPLPMGGVYSLNVPPIAYEQIKGLVPARLTPVFLGKPCYLGVEENLYRFEYNEPVPMTDSEGDVGLIERGYATITKVTWDFRMNVPDDDIRDIGM